jgi:hypothetical protein
MSQYKVGYKKPPLHSRFIKGRSGNPSGRPKKSILTMMEIFEEELARKITVTENGKTSKITLERAAIRQIIHKAVKGETAAFKCFMALLNNYESLEQLITVPTLVINPPAGPRPYPEPPIYGESEAE